jgi:hypothetical protein
MRSTLEPAMPRKRQTGMKTAVVLLALAVAGCTSGSYASHQAPAAAVSVQLKLQSQTMEAGSSMPAQIIVDNRTGHALHVKGCGSPFQIGLDSSSYHAEPGWPACLQTLTIATGKSSYRVAIPASYYDCGPVAQGNSRACLHGRPPPLPAGEYRAILFQSPQIVSAPAPIPVLVTPRSLHPVKL